MDICLLGTGGMMPLPYRWLTSMMARCEGVNLLIDCGEGTQIAIKEKGWSPKPIDVICFTHYHADHISGLPGLLLTMGNCQKTTPLLMIGPKGLERVVNALRVVAPELPFEIRFHELREEEEAIDFTPYTIEAYRVNHRVTCYGYRIGIARKGKFHPERAREQNIPLKFWNRLQHGEHVVDGEHTYTPDMVMGEARKGILVNYCTDTRPVPVIAKYAAGCDLFICEGMYGEDDKENNALVYKHMTMAEAAKIAAAANPKQMWFTHYSPSLNFPEEYMGEMKKIFPRAKAARDGWSISLGYENEE